MVGQNSDNEHTDTIKAMKELMESIRAESARRAAKLDAVFDDDFHATIKNAENMGTEMQSKAAMFEKILRTQSLIKRRTKETEFERSMKVLKKRQDSARNKATIGAETGTTTVKDNSDVYEGSETSTTIKKSSDSHIDSKCSVGGATSVDDKDVAKNGVAISAEFNNNPPKAVENPESPIRNKKFTFKGIGEATLLRLGQWRKNAARILHISKSSHEQARRRNARKKGIARLKSRLSRRRRLLGMAATSPTSSNAHKAINISQTARRRHKVRLQKIPPSSATSSSSDNKVMMFTAKDIAAADSSTQKIISIASPMSKDPLKDNVPPETHSSTATESKGTPVKSTPIDASSLTGASSQNESDQTRENKKNTSRTKKNKKGRSKKHSTVEIVGKPPPKQATDKKPESGSADADDSSTMTGKSVHADTKIEENNQETTGGGSNERRNTPPTANEKKGRNDI